MWNESESESESESEYDVDSNSKSSSSNPIQKNPLYGIPSLQGVFFKLKLKSSSKSNPKKTLFTGFPSLQGRFFCSNPNPKQNPLCGRKHLLLCRDFLFFSLIQIQITFLIPPMRSCPKEKKKIYPFFLLYLLYYHILFSFMGIFFFFKNHCLLLLFGKLIWKANSFLYFNKNEK